MNPEQYPSSGSGSPYDFIVNPNQPQRRAGLGKVGGNNNFLVKIGALLGGVVVLFIVAAVIANALLGNKNNLGDIIAIAQNETEMIRISATGSRASDQDTRNAATNTQYTLVTQRQQWVSWLRQRGTKLNDKTLNLKKNVSTDVQLNAARQTSTFDTVLSQLMRTQLQAYSSTLQDAYNNAASKSEKAMLQADYNQVQLLLKQWPS
jgi:predicted metalloprotease